MQTIVVAGAVANKPFNGGETWVRLSWVEGLKKLGFQVFLIEELNIIEATLRSKAIEYFQSVIAEHGLSSSASLLLGDGRSVGLSEADVDQAISQAALLVNISGHLSPSKRSLAQRSVFIDLDPGFTQIWQATNGAQSWFENHDMYFTIGLNIPKQRCNLPSNNVTWLPVSQPVVLSNWECQAKAKLEPVFSTIATWRASHGRVKLGFESYGIKLDRWRKIISLPLKSEIGFEAVLDIHPHEKADLTALRSNGWIIKDPQEHTATPIDFRNYVANSMAEFSPAQGVYVETQCGWFSDRSIRYLAMGKPVVVENTGIEEHFPTGEGLLTFTDLSDAKEQVATIVADYQTHSVSAHKLAQKYFDSDQVLSQFLSQCL